MHFHSCNLLVRFLACCAAVWSFDAVVIADFSLPFLLSRVHTVYTRPVLAVTLDENSEEKDLATAGHPIGRG